MSNELIKKVQYEVNGETIVVDSAIVSAITNNNKFINEGEVSLFLETAKAFKLIPVAKELQLVKYDNTKPAQMIVSSGAYNRKADENPQYEGMEDGILVLNKSNEIIRREGCSYYSQLGEKLVGGWARVYRKDRKIPSYAEVLLSEYTKGQSTWKAMPATMINKVAKVHAQRKAFPNMFNGLFISEELGIEDNHENIEKKYSFVADAEVNEIKKEKPEAVKKEIVQEVIIEHEAIEDTNETKDFDVETPIVEEKSFLDDIGVVEDDPFPQETVEVTTKSETPSNVCVDCGTIIDNESIITMTKQKTGRNLCWSCYLKVKNAQ